MDEEDSLLGLWVVGLTINNASGPSLINNESIVRIQFQNELYKVEPLALHIIPTANVTLYGDHQPPTYRYDMSCYAKCLV